MNTITKYYADAYGPDIKALVAYVRKAFELADSDDKVECVVFYSYTKNNFMQVGKIFGEDNVNQMFSRPMKFKECTKPIKCATEITYKRECQYKNMPKDVVVCCHMDSEAVFKVDDYMTAKYIIALSWNMEGLNEWKMRWHAQNVSGSFTDNESKHEIDPILPISLREMDNRMFNSKSLAHPDDEESCKTYVRTIHKYLQGVTPSDIENYLVTELGWNNRESSEVGKLLQRLKDGRTFRGGQKTYLKEYYNHWKQQLIK